MTKVTMMYPYAGGVCFDHGYYRERHVPLVEARLGNACACYAVDEGLAGGAPGTSPACAVTCVFTCGSVDASRTAMK